MTCSCNSVKFPVPGWVGVQECPACKKRTLVTFTKYPPQLYEVAEDETYCHAGSDGECNWRKCPQLRDNEPYATGRSCQLERHDDDQ